MKVEIDRSINLTIVTFFLYQSEVWMMSSFDKTMRFNFPEEPFEHECKGSSSSSV